MQQLLKLAEDSDNRPVNDGLDVPAEIARRDKRLAGIAQAKTKIEQRARERHAVEQQEYEAKCDKRQGQRDEGKTPRGPDPKVEALPQVLGQVEVLLADTGYFIAANVTSCEAQYIVPMLAAKRESHHIPVRRRLAADAPALQTDDSVVKMAHRQATKAGRALYGRASSRWSRCSGSSSA